VSLKPRTLCNKPARQVENHSEGSTVDFFPRKQTADNSGDILFYYQTSSTLLIINEITESQNHRMVGVGRDLCGSSSPTFKDTESINTKLIV